MAASQECSLVDCEEGRRMGCGTFCCYLLVRLDDDERPPPEAGLPAKGYVDKTSDGRCIHLDPQTGRCASWDQRPRICRSYVCNADPLLQTVLREGFVSLVQLTRRHVDIPREQWIQVPLKNR